MLECKKGEMLGCLRGASRYADEARNIGQQMWNEGEMMITVAQADEVMRLVREAKRALNELNMVASLFREIAAQRERMAVPQHKRVLQPMPRFAAMMSTEEVEIAK